ncbi:MAG TPA: MGMT family protein [Candidatus Dormibacteraeota bacterium]
MGAAGIGGDRIAAVAALVGRGEWTTYGEIAQVALGGRGARVVGAAAARGLLANAHRVLLAGGRISPGWGGGRVDECRRRLEAEGIRFRGGRADPARHLTWLDLASRFETRATLRS